MITVDVRLNESNIECRFEARLVEAGKYSTGVSGLESVGRDFSSEISKREQSFLVRKPNHIGVAKSLNYRVKPVSGST